MSSNQGVNGQFTDQVVESRAFAKWTRREKLLGMFKEALEKTVERVTRGELRPAAVNEASKALSRARAMTDEAWKDWTVTFNNLESVRESRRYTTTIHDDDVPF